MSCCVFNNTSEKLRYFVFYMMVEDDYDAVITRPNCSQYSNPTIPQIAYKIDEQYRYSI